MTEPERTGRDRTCYPAAWRGDCRKESVSYGQAKVGVGFLFSTPGETQGGRSSSPRLLVPDRPELDPSCTVYPLSAPAFSSA